MTPTTPPPDRPLIDVLNAACKGAAPPSGYAWRCYLTALADAVVPFEEVQGPYVNGPLGWIINTEEHYRCDERQRLRALLLAEAQRAEESDG